MDESEYFENLHSYIRHLSADIRCTEDIYQERLTVCRQCDYLQDAMCRACGCYVELRAAIAHNACPYEKWEAR